MQKPSNRLHKEANDRIGSLTGVGRVDCTVAGRGSSYCLLATVKFTHVWWVQSSPGRWPQGHAAPLSSRQSTRPRDASLTHTVSTLTSSTVASQPRSYLCLHSQPNSQTNHPRHPWSSLMSSQLHCIWVTRVCMETPSLLPWKMWVRFHTFPCCWTSGLNFCHPKKKCVNGWPCHEPVADLLMIALIVIIKLVLSEDGAGYSYPAVLWIEGV